MVTIVEQGAPLPSTQARTVTAEILRTAPIRLSAMVFEGQGFGAAAVRGVITGIGLLARTPYPHRTFATVTEAVSWIERETRENESMPRRSVEAAVAEVRC